MNVLLLCHYDPFNAAMVTDHIDAFSRFSEHDVFVHRTLLKNGGHLEADLNLDWFDIIVIHYSIFVGVDDYLSPRSRRRIAAARGLKVVFLQDEYRFVQKSVDGLVSVGAGVVFTCVPEVAIPAVYGDERLAGVRFINTLTGYIPHILTVLAPKELQARQFHVSYRGRRYPDWHGSLGREKVSIAEGFVKAARGRGLKLNISTRERDRLYGSHWIQLIQDSWAVLGVESGASVFDFSGEISAKTETTRALLGEKGISYQDMRKKYFAKVENKIDLAQISPRVFEAISLRTMCILFEGAYSNIIRPDEHYLMLKKDFSNVDDVIRRLKDPVYVAEITANAYFDVALNPKFSYKNFIASFDFVVNSALDERQGFSATDHDLQKLCLGNQHSDTERVHVLRRIEASGNVVSAKSKSNQIRSVARRVLPSRVKASLKRLLR